MGWLSGGEGGGTDLWKCVARGRAKGRADDGRVFQKSGNFGNPERADHDRNGWLDDRSENGSSSRKKHSG